MPNLATQVDEKQNWPTPTAADHRDRGGPSLPSIQRRKEIGKSIELSMTVDGALNADWVEALMGWPVGWTDLKPMEPQSWWDYDWDKWEPDIPRAITGQKDRAKRQKAIGNGQVSLCMAVAWEILK